MVTWVKTDKHVYGAIYREHHEDFSVFGTCSAPEGNPQLGISLPYMLTEWGFTGATEPMIKSIGTKPDFKQRDYDYEYFIALIEKDEE